MKPLLILFIVFVFNHLNSQTINEPYEPFVKLGIIASTNGQGIMYRQIKPYKNHKKFAQGYDIQFNSLCHEREQKIINNRMSSARPYVYGKINRLYNLKFSYGFHYALGNRNTNSSVGVNLFSFIGAQACFAKPTFLDISTADPNNPGNFIPVSTRYVPENTRPSSVFGYSSYFKGIGETKVSPGIHYKGGVEFNWGNYYSDFKSLEIGFQIDYLPLRPAILSYIKNKILYSGFYVSFAVGKYNP